MMTTEVEIQKLLSAKFSVKYAKAAIQHYQGGIEEFQMTNWEASIVKGGKFVEAVLKSLWEYVGEIVPAGKLFKAGAIIDGLGKKPTSVDDTIRLTIPRACRLIYDVASNRGGRHDAGEIDPNQMDATLSVGTESWILAEMIRYAQKDALDTEKATELVASLSENKLPFTENIEGRHYFSFKDLSARETELLALWKVHPGRIHRTELEATAARHGHTPHNAAVATSRLSGLVDDDGNGNLRLLIAGIAEARALIEKKRLRPV